jgi:anion-transporting  ArsA/GET3 family ATPase
MSANIKKDMQNLVKRIEECTTSNHGYEQFDEVTLEANQVLANLDGIPLEERQKYLKEMEQLLSSYKKLRDVLEERKRQVKDKIDQQAQHASAASAYEKRKQNATS